MLLFIILAGGFNAYYYASFKDTDVFASYLNLNAIVSGKILEILGTEIRVVGPTLISNEFSLKIAMGCDAIQPTMLFVCAVLAAPLSLRVKWPGLAVGIPLLLGVNLIRIVSLYYFGVYFSREVFEAMHIDVWQAMFIFLALFAWILWAVWAKRRSNAANNGGTD